MYCENCGIILTNVNQKFCPNCGIPLRRMIFEFDESGKYRRMLQEKAKVHSFENLKSMNYYFEIHSDWAHGNKLMLMISILLDQQVLTEIEENISKLLVKFSQRIKSNKEIYKAFYIKDLDHFDTNEKELITKNKALLDMEVNNLHQSIDELIREKKLGEERSKFSIMVQTKNFSSCQKKA